MSWYDDLWRDAPDPLPGHDVQRRRAFLFEHVRAGRRVLDLGCGEGDFGAAAAEAGADVLGVDVAEEAIRRARARHPELRFEHIDDTLPTDDATFDLVWCSEVLAHVLAATTPGHGPLCRLRLAVAGWERHFDPRGADLRFYTARSLRALLDDFGFDDVRVRARGGHLFAAARRAGIAAYDPRP